MNRSESIVEISKALADFQKEVKQPFKDADNPFFKSKYVPLESVVESINTTGPKHGLSFVQWPLNNEQGQVGVKTLLMHTSGEFLEFDPVFMNAEKQTPQGYGALITYIKRYSLSAIYGITSDKDDDGNSASDNTPPPKKQVAKATLEAKFEKGGGSMDGFTDWYGKQTAAGKSHNDMDAILTKALMKKGDKQ